MQHRDARIRDGLQSVSELKIAAMPPVHVYLHVYVRVHVGIAGLKTPYGVLH
jgi:hypothetical protein